jgi:PDZ domain-containing secreted protein
MSHFSIAKVKVQVKNIDLLKKSIQEVIQKLNGEQVSAIYDYYGNKQTNFIIAFKNQIFHRGVGIRINEKGEIELVGDFWGIQHEEVEKLKQMITQTYTKNATIQALKQLNYNVQVNEAQNKVHISAWRW